MSKQGKNQFELILTTYLNVHISNSFNLRMKH